MARDATVQLENTFRAPPAYVAAWLTDFREDDGPRYFGMPGPSRIRREGDLILTEAPLPIGSTRGRLTLESPTRWSAESEILDRRGRVLVRSRLLETVAPEGAGSRHTVRVTLTPESLRGRLMLPFMKAMMRRTLRRGFAAVRRELDAAFRAGRAPTE